VVDVSEPTAPAEAASLATVDSATGICIAGDHAYMAVNAEGLQIIDISEPTQPVAVSRIDTSAYAQSVVADDSYAYVSDYWGGLHVIDVSDPEQPAAVVTFEPNGFVFATAVFGRLAVVANGDLGLKVIDISNPAEIHEVGEIDTTGDAVWVAVSGARLVVAEDRAGLGVYSISGCAGFGVPEADFTWTPELPMAGEEILLTDTSQGQVTSWSWSFDDGATSHQQSPRHTFSAGCTYRVSLTVGGPGGSDTVTRKIEVLSAGGESPPVTEAGEYVTVIAGAAHAYGLEGTIWVTDVVVHNPGDIPAIFHLYYLEGGHANLDAVGHSFMVAGQTSLRLPDLIYEVFAKEGSGGALLIGSDQPLIVSSRTYNEQPVGSYGQYIPGLDIGMAVYGGQEVRLVQLAYSPQPGVGFRTNIGWVNLGTSNISVTARLFLGDGTFIGSKSYTIQPYSYFQRSNIFHQLSAVPIDDAYAIVTVDDSQARYLTYASVVDNRSGDPVYIQPGQVSNNR
jgi:PKD repeat protein